MNLYLLAHEGSQSEGKADMLTWAKGKDGKGMGLFMTAQAAEGSPNSRLPHHVIRFLFYYVI